MTHRTSKWNSRVWYGGVGGRLMLVTFSDDWMDRMLSPNTSKHRKGMEMGDVRGFIWGSSNTWLCTGLSAHEISQFLLTHWGLRHFWFACIYFLLKTLEQQPCSAQSSKTKATGPKTQKKKEIKFKKKKINLKITDLYINNIQDNTKSAFLNKKMHRSVLILLFQQSKQMFFLKRQAC